MSLLPTEQADVPQNAGESNICQYCLTIFLNDPAELLLSSRKGVDYRRTFRSLAKTIQNCRLCLLLVPTWDTKLQRMGKWLKRCGFDRHGPKVRFNFQGDLSSSNRIMAYRHSFFWRSWKGLVDFEVFTVFDDPAATKIPFPLLNGRKSFSKTFDDICRWLHFCKENHERCVQQGIDSIHGLPPSRLIDVSPGDLGADMICLKNTQYMDDSVDYAALSYCWGGPQTAATTMRTYSSYLQGISITALPQTLQDAILVTRRLGLRYLWVDSLCIVQDSDEDKIEQLGKMHSIYSNAYVTITACSPANCNEGFLQLEDRGFQEEEPSTIPFGTTGGHISLQKYIHPVFDFPLGPGKIVARRKEPINMRAWTFQEQYLSRRILFFSKTLVFWQCCEFNGKGGSRVREQYLGPDISRRVHREPTIEDWTGIVNQYSLRSMSDPTDKLPALSSIITYFASRTHSRYVAGICVAELPYQLCWERSIAGDSSTRPKIWRAPSWSWACINNPIHFKPQDECEFHPSFNTIELGCGVLDCHATPLSEAAPFGRVKSGFIRVRGRMLCCQPMYGSSLFRFRKYRLEEFLPAAGQSEGGEIEFDAMNKSVAETGWLSGPHEILTSQGIQPWDDPVYCLLLCTQKRPVYHSEARPPCNEEVWWPFGLALRKTGDGDFHRVGIFHGNDSSLQAFSEVEPETIRII